MLKRFSRIFLIVLLLPLAQNSAAQFINNNRTILPLAVSGKATENDLSEVVTVLGEASSLARSVVIPDIDSKKDKKGYRRSQDLLSQKLNTLHAIINSQARAGDISGAMRTSQSDDRLTLREIAFVQVRKGLLEDALQTIGHSKPDYILKKEVMLALLEAGQKVRAETIASDDPILLGFLAATQSKNGDPRFKDTFAQAIHKAVDGRHPRDMPYAIYPLVRIAQYQDLAGDPSMGRTTLSLAKKILEERSKHMSPENRVKGVIAIALAELTKVVGERRAELAQRVVDETGALQLNVRIHQLLQFSQDIRDQGHTDLAQEVLEQAILVSHNSAQPADQLTGLTMVATFLGQNGNKPAARALLERATTIAESLEEPGLLNPVYRELKRELGVLAVGTKGGELSRIVRISAELGFFDFAFLTARKLPDRFGQAKALAIIATELVRIKDSDSDRQIQSLVSAAVPLMPNSLSLTLLPHSDNELIALAEVKAAVRDIPGALHIVNAVSSKMRPAAYRHILNVLIDCLNFEESHRIVDEMNEDWLLDLATLKRLTREQSKSGYHARALHLPHSLANPLLKANALVGIADGMMDRKDVPTIPGLGQSSPIYDKGGIGEF